MISLDPCHKHRNGGIQHRLTRLDSRSGCPRNNKLTLGIALGNANRPIIMDLKCARLLQEFHASTTMIQRLQTQFARELGIDHGIINIFSVHRSVGINQKARWSFCRTGISKFERRKAIQAQQSESIAPINIVSITQVCLIAHK